jgi:exoribonuclease-2
LQQNGITELTATAFKDNLVRADDYPLVLAATGAQGLPRGAQVRIKLGEIDEIMLDISGAVTERLDLDNENDPQGTDFEDNEQDDSSAGPIAIAVDMDEPAADAQAAPA